MPRGAAGGVAVFALTAALACDNGGFDPTTWNLALVAVCAFALVVVMLGGGARPGLHAVVFVGALGVLTGWTALSYFWSDSPPLAPVEAQRVALYFAVGLGAVLCRAWLEPHWVAGGIAAAVTLVAIWNLVVHIRGVPGVNNFGALAAPVGYANSVALLCVLGMLSLVALPRWGLVAVPILVADLLFQHSTGAIGALVLGLAVYAFVAHVRVRKLAVLVIAVCLVGAPFALRGHERTAYWHVAVREAKANPVAGSGAGTFADWWLRDRPLPVSTREAHSLYLETTAELGPIGLALVLSALALPAAIAIRRRQPVLAALLVAYAAGAAFDFHWELAGATAPAMLAAGTAVSTPRGRRSGWPALPILVALVVGGILAYAGNARLAAAQTALQVGDRPRAAADARAALRFAPYSADAWEVIGDAGGGAAAYRRGLALDPNDWLLWERLAAASKGAPRRLALREAARLNPKGPSGP
jgi:hypothetical protein